MAVIEFNGRDILVFNNPPLVQFPSERRTLILVTFGAEAMCQAVICDAINRSLDALQVEDASESKIIQVVRDIWRAFGNGDSDFRTFMLDLGLVDCKLGKNGERGTATTMTTFSNC